jgi:hypothetical protein
MKAGDVSAVRTSSRETWLSTPLSDPNAALWASITPPANPTLALEIRRRAAPYSFDMLAHRLYRRFPDTFASRGSARVGILGAVLAFVAGLGALGYLELGSSHRLETTRRAHAPAQVLSPAPHGATSTRLVRLGETRVEHDANRAPNLVSTVAPARTAQAIHPLQPAVAPADAVRDTLATNTTAPQAKRAVAKKKIKSTPRRATRPRRARVTND